MHEQNETGKTLYFTKNDFFNEYEMKHFATYLSQIPEVDNYMKKAIINRVMIETQSDETGLYDKLMGYIQSKGIEQVISLIEKREQHSIIDEKQVEEIVHRVLNQRSDISISIVKEEELETRSNKTQEKPIEERKKASPKLRKL